MLRKLIYTAGAAALAAGFSGMASAPASALTIEQILGAAGGNFLIEDDDFENEIDGGGTPGVLEVNDRLRGVATFPFINPSVGPNVFLNSAVGNEGLGAIFEVEVLTKTLVSDGGTPADPTDDTYDFTFGASAAFEIEYETDAAIAFWSNDGAFDSGSLESAATTAIAEGLITGSGSHLWTLGFGADPDNFWLAQNASDQIGVVGASGPAEGFGIFNFGLDVLTNNLPGTFVDTAIDVGPAFDFDPGTGDGKVDFRGLGSILGGADATAYEVSSDADLQARYIVSEPATLAVFGMGLVGLGLAVRRRRTH